MIRYLALVASLALIAASPAAPQSIRLIKFTEGKPFHMGKVTSMRILYPDIGATQLSLNYSESENGAEFAQHVHDRSDDHILVLEGQALLRQGGTKTPMHTGQCAIVPAGQIHGTITTSAGKTTMISFQVPPDPALYTGARDSSRPGAPPPQGVITPGAVKYLDFAGRQGVFLSPQTGAARAIAEHRTLKTGETFAAHVNSGSQALIFVWKGRIKVAGLHAAYTAETKDTIFVVGPAALEVRADSPGDTVVILAQAPPPQS